MPHLFGETEQKESQILLKYSFAQRYKIVMMMWIGDFYLIYFSTFEST